MKRVSRVASATRTRRLWFGPGTVLALLIGGAALLLRFADRPAQAGPRAAGRLESAGFTSTSAIPSPTTPLWKPEAGLLLKRGRELGLTERQKTEIARLDRQWRADKAALDASLRDLSADTSALLERTNAAHGAPLRSIQSGLGDYSRLSREYDARRAAAWFQAVALLSKPQRATVDSWPAAGLPERSAR
jgi:hypothetical protein